MWGRGYDAARGLISREITGKFNNFIALKNILNFRFTKVFVAD